MKFFKFVLFFSVVMSCKEPTKEPFASFNGFIHQNINETLKTKIDKEEYLSRLFDFDQSLRNPDIKAAILKKNEYNTDSNEYQSYLKEMIRGDSIGFMLAKRYLQQYGYPKFETANYKTKSAIITVALHQDYSKQEVLFPYINEAYNTGKVEVNRFSFLVNRMYAFKFGERFEAKKGMTEKENINRIVKALDIIHLKKGSKFD
ncbi:hypothetical protein O4H26_04780 [Aequorivita viscosa]|nr:hypothetical protein [Aequorivita viscosa]